MAQFFEMGGYALYVWPAFAVTAAVMIGLLWTSLRRLRAREQLLRRLQDHERRRETGE